MRKKEIKESVVEDYLVERVKRAGGETRKVNWIGRSYAPDRRVMLPWVLAWVETKRPGKDAEAAQAREHARMRKLGEVVVVLDSKEAIDQWMFDTKEDAKSFGWSA